MFSENCLTLTQRPRQGYCMTVFPIRTLATGLLAISCQLPALAAPGCSREIVVPAAEAAPSISVTRGVVGGLMPDMLATVGARAGCSFRWSIVPRIRLEKMFEGGTADLLVLATRLTRRDHYGVFVPIVEARPMVISLQGEHAPIHSMLELAARRDLRIALVRGYDYGEAYQDMIKAATAQGHLYMEPDVNSVARLIAGKMADVTIMPAVTFIGGLQGDRRVEGIATMLRIEALDDLEWIETGIYLSRKSLGEADRALLEQALIASVKSGAWWAALKKYYPPGALHNNARPLPRDAKTIAP